MLAKTKTCGLTLKRYFISNDEMRAYGKWAISFLKIISKLKLASPAAITKFGGSTKLVRLANRFRRAKIRSNYEHPPS